MVFYCLKTEQTKGESDVRERTEKTDLRRTTDAEEHPGRVPLGSDRGRVMTEETIRITDEVRKSEEDSVRIEYYTLDGRRPEIYMCPGDLIVICNVLHDYAAAMEVFAEEDPGWDQALFEYHAQRCRKIQKQIETSMGYNVEEAVEKCRRSMNRKRKDDDVGEDAFVLAVRARGRQTEIEAPSRPEPGKTEKKSSDLDGQMDIRDFL